MLIFMKIYTRRGDDGKTNIADYKRLWKDDPRLDAIGVIDELNSTIGIVVSLLSQQKGRSKKESEKIKKILLEIQKDLFYIGASLADSKSSVGKNLSARVKNFEEEIDLMTQKLPPLSAFILPGGSLVAAFLHLARSFTRRAERRLVCLSQKEDIDGTIFPYINRLSDLFFTLARYANFLEKKKEIIWQK
jgi:cob(I)alamin adenosyltransferase